MSRRVGKACVSASEPWEMGMLDVIPRRGWGGPGSLTVSFSPSWRQSCLQIYDLLPTTNLALFSCLRTGTDQPVWSRSGREVNTAGRTSLDAPQVLQTLILNSVW